MKTFYRRLLSLILLVVLVSGGVIYTTMDAGTWEIFSDFHPYSIALALFSIACAMFFDGSRLMHLVHVSGEHITRYQAVQVVFGNYFLALLTPGATGGAVAQVMFLKRFGVSTGKATVLVIVRVIASILFLLMCMPFIFINDDKILPGIPNYLIILSLLCLCVLLLLTVWSAKKGIMDFFMLHITRRLNRQRRKLLLGVYRDTKEAVKLLEKSPRTMILVFLESGLNLLALYAIVPCLLLGLGVTDADWPLVMGRMIFLNAILYISPTPGGAGVAEGGFLLLFDGIVPYGTGGVLAVAWRIFAEYLPFLAGFYYTLSVFGKDFLHSDRHKRPQA